MSLNKSLEELAAEFGKASAAEIISEIIRRLEALEQAAQPAQPEQPAEESHQRA